MLYEFCVLGGFALSPKCCVPAIPPAYDVPAFAKILPVL